MKIYKYLFAITIILLSFNVSKAQFELTSPLTSTQCPIQNIKAGSLIIAMDTINQRRPGFFNLKAYGLVNELLQNEIPVIWAIKPGKAKNAVDFSANATRIYPDLGTTAITNFSCGPFIIDTAYLTKAGPIITAYGNNVHVFRLEANTNVNVRYNLTFKPKIALTNIGGYDTIAVKQLQEAGISASTYDLFMPSGQTFNPTKAYSTVSETHIMTRDTGKINPILRYVANNGSNLIAQCATLGSFENSSFPFTTLGVDSGAPLASPGALLYNNNDQAISQFHGNVINPYGDYKIWRLKSGSAFKSNIYHIVRSLTYNIISAGKLKANTEAGGNVLYLAGHEFFFWGNANGGTINDNNRINGRRMILNAMFLPPSDSLGFLDFRNDVEISILNDPGFAVKTETYKYYIVVKNSGLGMARNLNVNIPLPSGLIHSSYTSTRGTFSNLTNIWTLDSLARGKSDTLTLTFIINALGNISLSANVTTPSFETNRLNNSVTKTVFAVSRPTVLNDITAFPFGTYVDIESKFNDSDEDGDSFGNFSITIPPNHGTASILNGDFIRYTLGPGYTGVDSLQYVSCDILPLCDTAWIYILLPTPLPISLASFEGVRANNIVDLRWITLSEKNNDFFTIEKSNNGVTFDGIGEVKGAGTTNQIQHYNFKEKDSGEPILYYRIRQTDYDGTTTVSQIIKLKLRNNNLLELVIYPNPNSGEQMVLKINGLEENAFFSICDLTGREILNQQITPSSQGSYLDLISLEKKLEAGSYIASLRTSSEKISTRVIIN